MSGGCGSWSILEELLANEMLLKVWLQQTHRLELLGRKSWELLVTGGMLGVFSFQVSADFLSRCYTEWGLVNLLTGAEDDSDCLRTELGLVGSGPTSTNLLTGHYWARHHNKLSNTTPVTPHTLSSQSQVLGGSLRNKVEGGEGGINTQSIRLGWWLNFPTFFIVIKASFHQSFFLWSSFIKINFITGILKKCIKQYNALTISVYILLELGRLRSFC